MWLLLPPTVAYCVAHYIIANISTQISSHLLAFYKKILQERNGAVSRPGTDLVSDAYKGQVRNLFIYKIISLHLTKNIDLRKGPA